MMIGKECNVVLQKPSIKIEEVKRGSDQILYNFKYWLKKGKNKRCSYW